MQKLLFRYLYTVNNKVFLANRTDPQEFCQPDSPGEKLWLLFTALYSKVVEDPSV